jgi:hypothetical protein
MVTFGIGRHAQILQYDVASHAMAHHDWFDQRKLSTKPGKVVCKSRHRVILLGSVALAVSTKIDQNNSVLVTEELCLGRK